jgi:hypothetical protein
VFASFNRPDWRGGAVNIGIAMRPIMLAALLCAGASPSHGQASSDPATCAEFSQDALLAQIADAMHRTLRDPKSVDDLTMCAPIKIKLEDGRPVRWTVMLSFNARNGFGGYAGRSYYAAIFNAGKSTRLTKVAEAGAEGLAGLLTSATEKQMSNCPRVASADLQKHLQ